MAAAGIRTPAADVCSGWVLEGCFSDQPMETPLHGASAGCGAAVPDLDPSTNRGIPHPEQQTAVPEPPDVHARLGLSA